MENNEFNQIINNAKLLIDRNIYKVLFNLFYYFFLKTNKSSENKELKNLIEYINDKYKIKNEEKINHKYENKNLINIVKFVKTQNNLYAGEIIENILIIVFSFACQTEKENSFGKFIYNNIGKLKKAKNNDLEKWFIKEKLNDKISNIRELLKNDLLERDQFTNKIQEEPLYDLLNEIYSQKYKRKITNKRKIKNFANRRIFDFYNKIIQRENPNPKKGGSTFISSQYSSITFLEMGSNMYYDNEMGKREKVSIPLIRSLLISVYIFYQNKNSNLMKYREKSNDENNLQTIPFEYDISEAAIENKFAGIILSPLRIELRIDRIKLTKNVLKDNGFIELAKVLLFNKNIKTIDFHTCLLKSSYIDYLNIALGLFDNNSVEVLNLSYNYLKEDCAEYLPNILTHFKNLKTINLSNNDFKNGIASFLITLKKLYRQSKFNLESLNLNKCILDDISYYELGELLKSKCCKLQKLYLSDNNIPSNANFLKKLKKNRCLTQIYFNKSTIGNNNTDDIMRIISNSNIEYLYLHKNKINDFSQCLRIINRTRQIKKEGEIIRDDPLLYNLDLSNNICFNKNKDKIELLQTIINEMTLYCLDISHILYNSSLYIEKSDQNNELKKEKENKIVNKELSQEYIDSINILINKLENKQNEYKKTLGELNLNLVDQEKLLIFNNNKYSKKIDEQILNIINDKKAKYNIFLRKNAEVLISDNDEIRNETIINGIENAKKYKEVFDNLVKYMNLKRINKKIDELNKIKESKKMIII